MRAISYGAREDGSFSYRNAIVIEHAGQGAGCLIGYGIPDQPEPIGKDFPKMFVPPQELENLAPGTWYVNVVAVTAQHCNAGLGGSAVTAVYAMTGRGKPPPPVKRTDHDLAVLWNAAKTLPSG